jgi:WD40 repeat protein
MRDVFVCPEDRQKTAGAVHRLQFSADGRELAAWVEDRPSGRARQAGVTTGLYASDLATGTVRLLLPDHWFETWNEVSGELAVSPDLRLVAAGIQYEEQAESSVLLHDSHEPELDIHGLELAPDGAGALLFTPDGSKLVAVQRVWDTIEDGCRGGIELFEVKPLTSPKRRVVRTTNPLNGAPYEHLDVHLRRRVGGWLPVGAPPCTAALSTDGRLLAVGAEDTTVHVHDLKRKKLRESIPWEGRRLRYPAVTRIAFDPAGARVVVLAHARLFARPLGGPLAWSTQGTFGEVNDFAFHPDGRVLCAVFEDGRAVYLDPGTGAVRESFQWSKKPAPLYSVAFAPDGLTCAAGTTGGQVILWDVDV